MKNKFVIVILSYNSKQRTQYMFDALNTQTKNIIILENSNIDALRFINPSTINLGEENIGVGGFYDYIVNNLTKKYDFIGIFNNDITDIPKDFVSKLIPYLNPSNGILHPSLNDPNCPYEDMFHKKGKYRYVNFIENVCPIYNSNVLLDLQQFIPCHYFGWLDKILSNISLKKQLKNIVIDELIITHERSGVRKDMESIEKNYSNYLANAQKTQNEWVIKHPALKDLLSDKALNIRLHKEKNSILHSVKFNFRRILNNILVRS